MLPLNRTPTNAHAPQALCGILSFALRVAVLAVLASAAVLAGCSGEDEPPPPSTPDPVEDAGGVPEVDSGPPSSIGRCAIEHDNPVDCPCPEEGAIYDCKVWRVVDGYRNCSFGHNTCTDGVWGVCEGADGVAVFDPADLPADAGALSL